MIRVLGFRCIESVFCIPLYVPPLIIKALEIVCFS